VEASSLPSVNRNQEDFVMNSKAAFALAAVASGESDKAFRLPRQTTKHSSQFFSLFSKSHLANQQFNISPIL
jgi:hypothetical protein